MTEQTGRTALLDYLESKYDALLGVVQVLKGEGTSKDLTDRGIFITLQTEGDKATYTLHLGCEYEIDIDDPDLARLLDETMKKVELEVWE